MTRTLLFVAALAGCASEVRHTAPSSLRDTGLYADWTTKTIAAANRAYAPQYPLWTDGARKQRWIYLPPGAAIDATDPDAWQFPVGTKLWKELAFGGRTETRYMERAPDGWIYATYVWSAGERDATLAPARGVRTATEVAPGVRYAVPSETDCRACHANGATPVLGFSALQLSPDRDPNAPHTTALPPDALALPELIARGLVRGLPLTASAPRITARTPEERAALGYLHGNCGGCHRSATIAAQAACDHSDAAKRDVTVERGRYLVTTGGCHDCHTPLEMGPNGPEPDMSRALSGHPAGMEMPPPPAAQGPWIASVGATMTAWAGPWGTSYTANLTPDEATGLGTWTEQNFIDTIRNGRHMGAGRPLLPPMPAATLAQMTDDDLKSMFAYLRSIPAIENKVPAPRPPLR